MEQCNSKIKEMTAKQVKRWSDLKTAIYDMQGFACTGQTWLVPTSTDQLIIISGICIGCKIATMNSQT